MRDMKDSDIEWIGEMPKGWATEQVGRRADQTKCENDGMIETNLLSLSYGKVKRRDINATESLLSESFEGYNIIEETDIVLRFTDLQNDQKSLRVGRATERGIITSAYTTIRLFDSEDSEFLYYALHSYDLKFGEVAHQAFKENAEAFGSMFSDAEKYQAIMNALAKMFVQKHKG